MLTLIGSVVSGLFGMGKQWMERKADESEAKHAARMLYLQDKAAWEKFMAQGSMTSWKDEFWTLVIAAPLIMAFVPGAVEHVKAGFAVLASFPEWYLYFLGIAFGAAFGVKPVSNTIVDAIQRGRRPPNQ